MVAISSRYPFGADKAVQINQALRFDKGTQPELRHKKCKINLLIWISDLLYNWFFWFQTFGTFKYCSSFYAHATDFFSRSFYLQNGHQSFSVKTRNNENATLSMVNIAINDNQRL